MLRLVSGQDYSQKLVGCLYRAGIEDNDKALSELDTAKEYCQIILKVIDTEIKRRNSKNGLQGSM